jgi:two-component system nitrogen regulation sensor histidine kinase NtrY
VAVVPLAGAAALLAWTGDFPQVVWWTVLALIAATLVVATFALREVIVYPLRTMVNVISAVREEDYSLRALEATNGAIFGELLLEMNELSATMRRRHLALIETTALVRAVMTEVDAAIFAFDAESRLELVNRAGERYLGIDEPLGKTAAELGLDALLAGGEAERSLVRVSTFRREGETHRLLVVADISRALRQEEIRAWQRVVRVLGHELNNSLAPIKSIAGSLEEALATKPIDARLQSDLERGLGVIARRADALAKFLSGYSELARLPEPTLRPIELSSLIADLHLDIRVEGGPSVTIEADRTQLEQVLINLVKNAVEAGGGAVLSWRLDADLVELSIVDEGPGLAATANLFVPFFTTKPGGSGIGLVLSRQIAEAHGGTLTLRNRGDRTGCEALLRLPTTTRSPAP